MEKTDLLKLQVDEKNTVKDAMKRMDQTGLKILFVVNSENRFLGTITDGDFRRWLLSGKSLNDKTGTLCNKNPVKFPENYRIEEIKKAMVEKRLESVPIVNDRLQIVDALFWEDIFGEKYEPPKGRLGIPLAIMAGGKGTRFSTVTKILPKALIPYGEKPVIEAIMDNFAEFGCDSFYLLLGYKGAMVMSYFENSESKYVPTYFSEKEPRGTAGALRFLLGAPLSGSFFVTNCDTIIKADYADILDFHEKTNYEVTVVSAMRHFVIPSGVMEMSEEGSLEMIKEKPEYDFLVNTGMYLIKKEILTLIPEGGEFHFTDLLKKAQSSHKKIGIYPISEKSWIDIGQPGLWEESDTNLSDKAKTNPRCFEKDSGVATVAFEPMICLMAALKSFSRAWSAVRNRRLTSPASKGETAWT